MKGIDTAVELLLQAREEQWRVLIVGDYDVDGATSTALAVLGLRSMGLQVEYLLPNRFEYGYGLSPEIVDLALQSHPNLIVTVDNGISSLEGVAKAQAAGVKVLVTDHHLAGKELPNADAIVNPNQPGCPFPSKSACGCTVMYYCLIALRAKLRALGESNLPNLGQWLDIVALATVADVVPLDENNRRLVAQGLQRIKGGHVRPGIKALFEVAGRQWRDAKSSDFGFVVGPRLNAAGRLDDMTRGVQLLLTDSDVEARSIAVELHDLNSERRNIEASMLTEANHFLSNLPEEDGRHSIVVAGHDWHEGVIGILASRIKDKVHKPVVAFSPAGEGQLKGSARSVAGVHMRDALDWVAKQDATIMSKFGGHAMAAGLSIQEEKFEHFKVLFDQAVAVLSEPEALVPHLWCDGEIPDDWLTLDNALLLESAGPWGQAFPEPVFYGRWPVVQSRVLSGKHLKLTLQTASGTIDAIAFNLSPEQLTGPIHQVQGLYQLSCNRFRGDVSVQLMFSKLDVTS
jgi:single-stranded-DNA-specific exonuclease